MVWISRAMCLSNPNLIYRPAKTQLQKSVKSSTEKALEYVEKAPRIKLQDLRDNPGARTVVCEFYFKQLCIF